MSLLDCLRKLGIVPLGLSREAHDVFADSERVRQSLLKHFPALEAENLSKDSFTPDQEFASVARRQWQNYVSTQIAEPFQVCHPTTLGELKDGMKEAAAAKCPVRAVGSGHSWSDAALTDGFLIETTGLAGAIQASGDTLRNPEDAATLVEVESGITIKNLNSWLDSHELALLNMGGYDGQTIAGVISTSTHGSGLSLGSFPSFVEALVVVTADGEVLQIEKARGISDPAKFGQKYGAARSLRQDDQLFSAAVVGIGCLGVIYAVVLRVTTKYWLSEVRVIAPWAEVRTELKNGDILKEFRHVEVLVNPYPTNGGHNCLVTTRTATTKPPIQEEHRPFRHAFGEFIASLPEADRVLALLFNDFPHLSPTLINQALEDLEDDDEYTDLSYRIFNVGAANNFRVVCAEYGVDLELQVDAIDAILDEAQRCAVFGVYHSSPIAMRWVAASPGFLSMQPRSTCMIEIPMLRGVFGADEMLWRYENLLTRRFKARPHWGQRNFLTGSRDMIRELYPQFDEWLKVFETFNKDGRFASRFTDRVGISSHAPKG